MQAEDQSHYQENPQSLYEGPEIYNHSQQPTIFKNGATICWR
jgi:hypothetical protein